MVEALQCITAAAVAAHPAVPRIDWVLRWPGQVVLAVTAIFWTQQVATAIASTEAGAIAVVEASNTADLDNAIQKVRGKLSPLQRATLSALVVVDVHARDIVSTLKADGVDGQPGHFSWLAQLRMYWENTDPGDRAQRGIAIRMMNASAVYGYEYLGSISRLVITPLTDRAVRTLIGAIHMNLGGALEGPAGSGKTETVKDLAKVLARQCLVFNCSASLDYLTMAKFFKARPPGGLRAQYCSLVRPVLWMWLCASVSRLSSTGGTHSRLSFKVSAEHFEPLFPVLGNVQHPHDCATCHAFLAARLPAICALANSCACLAPCCFWCSCTCLSISHPCATVCRMHGLLACMHRCSYRLRATVGPGSKRCMGVL
jgi:hypothetical protein